MTTTRSRRTRRLRRRGATTRGPQRSTATTSTPILRLSPSLNLLLCADQSVFQLIHRSARATSPPTTIHQDVRALPPPPRSRLVELASPPPRRSPGARRVLRPPTRRRRAAKRASQPPTPRHRARRASPRSPRRLDGLASPPTLHPRRGFLVHLRPNRRLRTRLRDEPAFRRVKRASPEPRHRVRPRLRAVLASQRARTRRHGAVSAARASPRRRPSRRRRATTTRG